MKQLKIHKFEYLTNLFLFLSLQDITNTLQLSEWNLETVLILKGFWEEFLIYTMQRFSSFLILCYKQRVPLDWMLMTMLMLFKFT